jgi:hypothetical protein
MGEKRWALRRKFHFFVLGRDRIYMVSLFKLVQCSEKREQFTQVPIASAYSHRQITPLPNREFFPVTPALILRRIEQNHVPLCKTALMKFTLCWNACHIPVLWTQSDSQLGLTSAKFKLEAYLTFYLLVSSPCSAALHLLVRAVSPLRDLA